MLKKIFISCVALLGFSGGSNAQKSDKQVSDGAVGQVFENGVGVIYSFSTTIPDEKTKQAMPWLMTIAWEYDGAKNKSMPSGSDLEKMYALEKVIDEKVLAPNFMQRAYGRTGNNLKELVYYIKDQDSFLEKLNAALREHPSYPIKIDFYHDPDWSDLSKLIALFNTNTAK
jgi:Family of unknown function (DUF695)